MARDLTGHQFCLIMSLAFALVVVAAGDATAETTWYVDDDAPADFSTIQAALNAASDGDTIIVRDGTYTGDGNRDIDFAGKAVHLRSENGPETCIIDAEGSEAEPHRGFYFLSGEDENSVVDGFTITNVFGRGDDGGSIYCYRSWPTITNNTIAGNTGESGGGGIYCYNASPTITNNTFTRNTASCGGGVYCTWYSSPTITNNTITANTARFGAGVYCRNGASPTIANNTITGNMADGIGGGVGSYLGSPTITNCILWGNGDDLDNCSATYSCIQDGDAGQGNISSYPYFVDPDNGDYRLLPWSPCIDAGDPGFAPQPGETDIDGNPRVVGGRVDMGACEAAVKSPDTDSDGLPDGWEIDNFGNLSYGSDDDPDGDGLTDLGEYGLGTNPKVDSRTIYVSAANAGDILADGSIDHPYARIQQGVDASIERVLVAEGTYSEQLVMDGNMLHILGGYDGTFAERDAASRVTVIDAEGVGPVVRYCQSPTGTLDGFTITGGAASRGGGISCSRSSPAITNNTITANTALDFGGGISCSKSSPTITNNTIAVNTATDGGGVHCSNSSPTVTNNTITANTALEFGGGISCYNASSPTITNNTIAANTAAFAGGGISCYNDSSPTIANNTITANTGDGHGGGIYCYRYSSPTITNNTITANTARYSGGGIYCSESSPAITNNTITGNTARHGGGVHCHESSPTVGNSILWGNSATTGPEIHLGYTSSLIVRYSNVAAGAAMAYVDSSSTLDLDSTNIDADPFFADPDNGDYHLKSQHGRWDPTANAGAGGWVFDAVTSPCIDAGDPASDYSDEPMPNFGRVNMGAYGNTPETSKSAWNIPGDINGDCVVNVLDLLNVRNRFGQDPASDDNWKADLNDDGVINVLDLIFVRDELGAICQ